MRSLMRPLLLSLALLLTACATVPGGIMWSTLPFETQELQAVFLVPASPEAHQIRPEYADAIASNGIRVGMSMAEVHATWGWPSGQRCRARAVHGQSAIIQWGYWTRGGESPVIIGQTVIALCWSGTTLIFNEHGILTGWSE